MTRTIKGAVYIIEGKGAVYDEDLPQYKYFIPHYTGDFCAVDCDIVDKYGKKYPHCLYSPIQTENMRILCNSQEIPYDQHEYVDPHDRGGTFWDILNRNEDEE